ncbi:hypothetical protein Tco_0569587 [Tanacetum coccineum]
MPPHLESEHHSSQFQIMCRVVLLMDFEVAGCISYDFLFQHQYCAYPCESSTVKYTTKFSLPSGNAKIGALHNFIASMSVKQFHSFSTPFKHYTCPSQLFHRLWQSLEKPPINSSVVYQQDLEIGNFCGVLCDSHILDDSIFAVINMYALHYQSRSKNCTFDQLKVALLELVYNLPS